MGEAAARALCRLAREPVMLVAAVLGTLEAVWPEMSSAWKLAMGLWGALVQRSLSASKAEFDEKMLEAIELGKRLSDR